MYNDEYDYSFHADKKYCFPGSTVLKNKLNITDKADLNEAEREITAIRIMSIEDYPIKGKFDFKHLKDIHFYVFQDIYEWAGQIRTVNISKGNVFCYYQNIESYASSLFNKLKVEKFLITADKKIVFDRLSFYMSEINALHPFREGNGRVQRIFISYLAKVAGYELNFSEISDKDMIEISSRAFREGHEEYITMFENIAKPISLKEQDEFIYTMFN